MLLNHHRKADGWLAFGGHFEPGDATLAGVALREAHEESGLTDFDFDPVPLDLDEHAVEFCSDRGTTCTTSTCGSSRPRAPRRRSRQVSEESLDVRWWPVDALPAMYDDMCGPDRRGRGAAPG